MGAIKEPTASLYEADYHAWTQEQAAKLKRGDFAHIDVPNLIEEIESLGRSEERELASRLAQLLMHLLKWEYQRLRRGKSWTRSIREQRRSVEKLLQRMPSLRPTLDAAIADAYPDALVLFERDTGLNIVPLPEECPYTVEQVLLPDWLPPSPSSPRV